MEITLVTLDSSNFNETTPMLTLLSFGSQKQQIQPAFAADQSNLLRLPLAVRAELPVGFQQNKMCF